jgi:hypothetical protein
MKQQEALQAVEQVAVHIVSVSLKKTAAAKNFKMLQTCACTHTTTIASCMGVGNGLEGLCLI